MKRFGWVLVMVGAVIAVPLWVLKVIPSLQALGTWLIAYASFIPFAWIPTLLALVGAAIVTRKTWRKAFVVVTVLVVAAIVVPMFGPRAGDPERYGDLQFISLNAQYGNADADEILALVEDSTDLVAIQEFTPEMQQRLEAAGLPEAFPHFVGEPRNDAGGVGVYSRRPIEVIDTYDQVFTNLLTETKTEGGHTVRFAVVHAAPPQLGASTWRDDGRAIAEWLRPHVERGLVVVGDFNAISDHLTMRYFADAGLTDPLRGSPLGRSSLDTWQPTWPVGSAIPPFVQIDHMLIAQEQSFAYPAMFEVAGTDHKAIVGGIFMTR